MKHRRTFVLNKFLITKLDRLAFDSKKSKSYIIRLALDNLDYHYVVSGKHEWKWNGG